MTRPAVPSTLRQVAQAAAERFHAIHPDAERGIGLSLLRPPLEDDALDARGWKWAAAVTHAALAQGGVIVGDEGCWIGPFWFCEIGGAVGLEQLLIDTAESVDALGAGGWFCWERRLGGIVVSSVEGIAPIRKAADER